MAHEKECTVHNPFYIDDFHWHYEKCTQKHLKDASLEEIKKELQKRKEKIKRGNENGK